MIFKSLTLRVFFLVFTKLKFHQNRAPIWLGFVCALLLNSATFVFKASAEESVLKRGENLVRQHCTRCHVVGDMNRYGGIGSTPSFGAIKTMPDWKERFEIFYNLPPHPAVVTVQGISKERSESLPAFVAQIILTIDEVEDLLSFIDEFPASK